MTFDQMSARRPRPRAETVADAIGVAVLTSLTLWCAVAPPLAHAVLPQAEQQAISALYTSTGGSFWSLPVGGQAWSLPSDPCTQPFYGVTCDVNPTTTMETIVYVDGAGSVRGPSLSCYRGGCSESLVAMRSPACTVPWCHLRAAVTWRVEQQRVLLPARAGS